MAISNYANLKASIGDFLNRSDLATDQSDGSTVIEKFIELAEAEFNRRLRLRSMVTRSTISVSGQFTDLSSALTDYLELKNITLEPTSGGPIVLEFKTPQAMDEFRFQRAGATGRPICYGLIGFELELGPVPDATYSVEITYYKKIQALTDSNTTNFLLTSHPDLYLYGSLVHSAPYLIDDPRIAVWKALTEERMQQLVIYDERGENPGTALNMSIKRPYFSGAVSNPIYYR